MKKRFTRIAALFCAVVLVCAMMPITAVTVNAAVAGDYEYTALPDRTAIITDYTGAATDLTIPSKLGGCTVIAVESRAFADCTSLISVTIPDSVRTIGECAFLGCASLAGVNILGNVVSVGHSAFRGCTALTDIALPDSVATIGCYAFRDCVSLVRLVLPSGMTAIAEGVVFGCTALESVTIPDSVTSIGAYAFSRCTALQSIALPSGLASIGKEAFSGCVALQRVVIPDSVTTIAEETFYHCTSLGSVSFPKNVMTIGDRAFFGCMALRCVFYDGTTAQQSIMDIGENNTCLVLAAWYFTVATIVQDGFTFAVLDDGTAVATDYSGAATEVVIPAVLDGKIVTTLGEGLFSNSNGITQVTVPIGAETIYPTAFDGCADAFTMVVTEGFGGEDYAIANDIAYTTVKAIAGDVTLNGVTDIADAVALFRAANGREILVSVQPLLGNVARENDAIDIADAVALFRYVNGRVTSFE